MAATAAIQNPESSNLSNNNKGLKFDEFNKLEQLLRLIREYK